MAARVMGVHEPSCVYLDPNRGEAHRRSWQPPFLGERKVWRGLATAAPRTAKYRWGAFNDALGYLVVCKKYKGTRASSVTLVNRRWVFSHICRVLADTRPAEVTQCVGSCMLVSFWACVTATDPTGRDIARNTAILPIALQILSGYLVPLVSTKPRSIQ